MVPGHQSKAPCGCAFGNDILMALGTAFVISVSALLLAATLWGCPPPRETLVLKSEHFTDRGLSYLEGAGDSSLSPRPLASRAPCHPVWRRGRVGPVPPEGPREVTAVCTVRGRWLCRRGHTSLPGRPGREPGAAPLRRPTPCPGVGHLPAPVSMGGGGGLAAPEGLSC